MGVVIRLFILKSLKIVFALALSCYRYKHGKSRGKQVQLIPCTVVLYDKGGKIQQPGYLVTECWTKIANKTPCL